MNPVEIAEHLAGLQAQTTNTWYVGFWSRMESFDPQVVSQPMEQRELVRIALMRSTIHLVSAQDCLDFRLPVQPPIVRSTTAAFGKNWTGLDLDEVVSKGRQLLEQEPLTFNDLGKKLQESWPDRDAASLAQAVRAFAPLIQTPPRGLWGRSGLAKHTTAEAYLGKPLNPSTDPAPIVLRYLKAFGPATVMDAQNWSGLTKLGEVFERLRPRLVTVKSEDGKELFDLPEAPRPDEDTPAPARILYDFDNVLLGHADRSRIIDQAHVDAFWIDVRPVYGKVLIDGEVQGVWRVEKGTFIVTSLKRIREAEIAEEGMRLLTFLAPKAEKHDVQFALRG